MPLLPTLALLQRLKPLRFLEPGAGACQSSKGAGEAEHEGHGDLSRAGLSSLPPAGNTAAQLSYVAEEGWVARAAEMNRFLSSGGMQRALPWHRKHPSPATAIINPVPK